MRAFAIRKARRYQKRDGKWLTDEAIDDILETIEEFTGLRYSGQSLINWVTASCARDGASRTLLLVSVEVSEARSSMSTIEVDTVHSDERTISLAVIFVFIIYVRFIGIFYYPETPSDLVEVEFLQHVS